MLQFLFLITTLSLFHPLNIYAHGNQVVEMTETGFIPTELTIDQNTWVTFVNQDTRPHWPASNPHPTHTLYRDFDPKKPLLPGETWKFQTGKIGTWRYHDHLNPHQRAVLTVVQENDTPLASPSPSINWVTKVQNRWQTFISWIQALRKRSTTIPATPSQFAQFTEQKQQTYLETYMREKGAKVAWKHLTDIEKTDRLSSSRIHDLAHVLGSLMYTVNDTKGIVDCGEQFGFGCYHGFLDQVFTSNLSKMKEVDEACAKSQSPRKLSTCFHGIGHGIASFYHVTQLDPALRACNTLTQARESCYDGVLMEFARDAPVTFYSQTQPLYPCNVLENKYQQACGRNQPTVFMERFKYDIRRSLQTCSLAKQNTFKTACLSGLGFFIARKSLGDAEFITQECGILAVSDRAVCISGAAGELVYQNIPNGNTSTQTICNSLPLSFAKSCLTHVKSTADTYGND